MCIIFVMVVATTESRNFVIWINYLENVTLINKTGKKQKGMDGRKTQSSCSNAWAFVRLFLLLLFCGKHTDICLDYRNVIKGADLYRVGARIIYLNKSFRMENSFRFLWQFAPNPN